MLTQEQKEHQMQIFQDQLNHNKIEDKCFLDCIITDNKKQGYHYKSKWKVLKIMQSFVIVGKNA